MRIAKPFWSYVDKRSDTECWEWIAAKDSHGYGRYNQKSAHRLAYMLTHDLKTLPSTIFICHSCDNPGCCNPAHLFAGSGKDNMQDAASKNRLGKHLTNDQVGAIRQLYYYDILSKTRIARELGISPAVVTSTISFSRYVDTHPMCGVPATHFVYSPGGGFFIPLCSEHKKLVRGRPPQELSNASVNETCYFIL